MHPQARTIPVLGNVIGERERSWYSDRPLGLVMISHYGSSLASLCSYGWSDYLVSLVFKCLCRQCTIWNTYEITSQNDRRL